MRQATETFHVLQVKIDVRDPHWHKPLDDRYRPAELLAYQGRLVEAIEEAQRIHIKKHATMHGVRFRVVTTTRTVTVASGPFEDAIEEFPRG